MAGRFRRFTITGITGARDFRFDDQSEWNNDRADNEAGGDFVRMSEGPYDVSFELLDDSGAPDSGYTASLVVAANEVTVSGGSESVATRTYTFSDGYLNVGGDHSTESPGRISVTGQFKTLVIS